MNSIRELPKRAEVYRDRRYPWRSPQWIVTVHEGDIPLREQGIYDRDSSCGEDSYHDDYPTALAFALSTVGLAKEPT